MAFAKLVGEPMDNVYREGGDKYDNLIGGNKYDIKCATKNYGKLLIYHTNEWGKKIPLNKDIYVSCYIKSEERSNKKATIIVVGFVEKEDVKDCKVEPGIKGNGHLNYVLLFHDLRPICPLIQKILKREERY